jgi:hypothetical protein
MAAWMMFLVLSGCGCDKLAKADSLDTPDVSMVSDESGAPVVVMLRDSADPDCPSPGAGEPDTELLSAPIDPPTDPISDPVSPSDPPIPISSSPQIVLEQAEDIEDDLDGMLERLRAVQAQQQGERNEARHDEGLSLSPPG